MCQKKTVDNPEQKRVIDVDRILVEEIGNGKYQLRALAPCGLAAFLAGYSIMGYLFTAARTKTRCFIPECDADNDPDLTPPWISLALPKSGESYDNCHRFASSVLQNTTPGTCSPGLFDRNTVIKCTQYVYENKNSAVYEFELVCDEWRWFIIGSSLVVGTAISLPIAGYVADRWGRRVAITINSANYAWINIMTYWADSYYTFVLCGFLGRLFGAGVFFCCNILVLEHVGRRHRMAAGSAMSTCMALGTAVQGLVAWSELHWRHLILLFHVPLFINIGLYWILPESVRWLISKDRVDEAKMILVRAAEMNGKTLSEETLKSFSEEIIRRKADEKKEDTNLLCLVFQHKTVLLRCIIAPIWWITVLFITQGMAITAVNVSGNKYLNYSAVALVAIPGVWSVTFFINKLGRKPMLIGGFWASSACQLGYIFAPKGHYTISLALYLMSRFFISGVMTLVFVYTTELMPTCHRSRLSTFFSSVGRIGAFVAPLTPALATEVWEHLPFVLFAGMAFLSGLLVLLTPETLGSTLPESMEDANNLGKDQPSLVRSLLRKFVSNKECYSLG